MTATIDLRKFFAAAFFPTLFLCSVFTALAQGDSIEVNKRNHQFAQDGLRNAGACSNWLNIPSQPSYVRIGDLDIAGDQVTVEASFIRTAAWSGSDLFQGDLVSKHEDPTDCNYLLRPSSAEITTTRGYFKTPVICPIELNKTYHAAMVYDGKTLKFYRNGFLMSQIAASGNLVLNDWQTQIGLYFNQVTQENFIGFINEVRIWNVARSQDQIRSYMDQSLPSPQSQSGLLAYYTFDNLANKQGNPTWNGTLGGSASINATNPNCTYIADSCGTCSIPPFDYSFQQDICSPKAVQFTTSLPDNLKLAWDFGDGYTDVASQAPSHLFTTEGVYDVKLIAQSNNTCKDSVIKSISVATVPDNALVLTNDTSICLGDSLQIRTQKGISNFCWSASTGTAPQEPDAYVKPSIATTYSFTAEVTGPNLIVNGDFSQGNTGFTSEYNYSSSGIQPGVFSVGSNISAWHSGMSPCNDHTTGSGNMMMVNGADKKGIVVWSETVNVQPNTNYVFYTWLQHITTVNPARLQFSINGVRLGNIFQANQQSCLWERFFSNWNSGDNTTATISIVNMNEEYSGNDFALDDIFFVDIVTKTDSLTVNVVGLCDSVKIEGPQTICAADTVKYSVYKSPNCTQQYYLDVDENFADIVERTDTSIRLRFTQNGSTTIRIAYSNDCKIAADSLQVTIRFSPPAINLGPDVVTCADTSLQLDAGEGFVSYVWQDGSTASTLVASSPDNYSVKATNLCGEQFTDVISIVQTEPKPFAVSPSDAAVCKGDYVEFTASGGTDYSWSPATSFLIANAPLGRAVVDKTQDFTVHITDSICQRDTIITVSVTALEQARVSLSKSNDVNCTNDSAVLVASGGVTYTWSPDVNISRRDANSITVKPYESTTYVVHGLDESGCAGVDSVRVIFTKEGDQKLFVPTAFTPNADGLNDLFKPIFVGPSLHYDFRIYNRWGQLLFRSKTPGAGWDGRFNGNPQKADVYVFYVTAEGGCNGKFEQKGTFALIR